VRKRLKRSPLRKSHFWRRHMTDADAIETVSVWLQAQAGPQDPTAAVARVLVLAISHTAAMIELDRLRARLEAIERPVIGEA
jgi:hypothetical protein